MSNLARVAFMLAVVAPLAAIQTAQQPNPGPKPASQVPARTPVQPVTALKPSTTPVPPSVRLPVAQPAASAPVSEVRSSQPAAPQAGVVVTAAPAAGSRPPAAVDYASGQLTVVAENAPLGVVLNMIAAKTGAVVDFAPELQDEPVVARLGPSSVREVLTQLLDSPRIDYIVLGGSDEGDRLQRVVVRIRHSMGLFAMSPSRQPKQVNPDQEVRLDPNGHMSGTEAQPQLSQQRMANWQKARESMRLAEIRQQAQERENQANGSPDPPPIPQENQLPDPPPAPQGDPPQH